MGLTFSGYLPKRITPRPADYDLPGVTEIASVSRCIAKPPEDWIKSWRFNALGLFDDEVLADSLVPDAERSDFDIYGYAFLDRRFDHGAEEAWSSPPLTCVPPDERFERLGFDAVSRSQSDFFECSPLSCNGAAREVRVNAYCLFESLDEAIAAAKAFSAGNAEPGPYYVAEVLRRRRPTGPIRRGPAPS